MSKAKVSAENGGDEVVFLNPMTCGIYKDGGARYKIDHATGERTDEIDNELGDHVDQYLAGTMPPGVARAKLADTLSSRVLVPRYYDMRWEDQIRAMLAKEKIEPVTIGELIDQQVITVRGGHGSPSNDKRTGNIPYVKVSDIRSLRVNVNPTNLVTRAVAEKFWRKKKTSGLQAWDLITPNRASSNIGEFAILLPGEEQVFIIRVVEGGDEGYDPFYLLWCLCLKVVRRQWQRVTLMQTNREDCGNRYREIVLPKPKSKAWADEMAAPFRDYFTTLATARTKLLDELTKSGHEYIASAHSVGSVVVEGESSGGN